MLRIKGSVKNYDWGNDFFIDDFLVRKRDGKRKAELWFGSHPNGPSVSADTGEIISIEGFPFLFKILAIDKCLSLQVHPTLEQAASGKYQDLNQKAEVFCSLTPVTAMCGFRPLAEIKDNFRMIFGDDSPIDEAESVHDFFSILYQMKKLLPKYHEFLKNQTIRHSGEFKSPLEIAIEISSDYPDDPAILAPWFLNVVHLNPGQTIYLRPRVIHCYVFGNGVELMNSSDNVIRAGLTHKEVNRSELENVSLFEHTVPDILSTETSVEGLRYLIPDAPGFELSCMEAGSFDIPEGEYRILICTQGTAKVGNIELSNGQALLAMPEEGFHVDAEKAQLFAASGKRG
ncbi:MAG: mannose-6-phosphate isomerase, class I [Sphaerochaetaceae bacterium]|nr:mannose-6-phosphate isomerase, class I [Sphaerochaetaceae bacterium]